MLWHLATFMFIFMFIIWLPNIGTNRTLLPSEICLQWSFEEWQYVILKSHVKWRKHCTINWILMSVFKNVYFLVNEWNSCWNIFVLAKLESLVTYIKYTDAIWLQKCCFSSVLSLCLFLCKTKFFTTLPSLAAHRLRLWDIFWAMCSCNVPSILPWTFCGFAQSDN